MLTLPAMENSGRNFSLRAFSATALLHRTWAPTRMRCLCEAAARLAVMTWEEEEEEEEGRSVREDEGMAREKSRVDIVCGVCGGCGVG